MNTLINFQQLSVEQINEALVNAGYTDNNLLSATYKGMDTEAEYFVYEITYRDEDNPLAGNLSADAPPVEKGKVFVSVRADGNVIAEF